MTQLSGNSLRRVKKKGGEWGVERRPPVLWLLQLIPCQSVGRESLSTLELQCLSFTHQTICFIRFIFTPSHPVQPDKALMMKRRGHPCIISELACTKVRIACVCVSVCVFAHKCRPPPQQYDFGQTLAQTAMPTHQLILTICSALRTSVTPHSLTPSSPSLFPLSFPHTPTSP